MLRGMVRSGAVAPIDPAAVTEPILDLREIPSSSKALAAWAALPRLLELPRPRPELPNVRRDDEETSPRLSVAVADEVLVLGRALLDVPLLDVRDEDVRLGAVATSSGTGFFILDTPELLERLEPVEEVRVLEDARVLPVDVEVEEALAALFSLLALMRSRNADDGAFGFVTTGSSSTGS